MVVKLVTHAVFDEGFNDLPIEAIPPNYQHIQRINENIRKEIDADELHSSDLHFLVYPFSDKQVATILVLSGATYSSFGFELKDDKLLGHTYISNIKDTVSSSASKSFGDIKRSRKKLQ